MYVWFILLFTSNESSPKHWILPVTPRAAKLPSLISNCDFPQCLVAHFLMIVILMMNISSVSFDKIRRLVCFIPIKTKVHRCLSNGRFSFNSTRAPGPHPQTVTVLLLVRGTKGGVGVVMVTRACLGEAGTVSSSVKGRSQNVPDALLQGRPAGAAAGGPMRKGGDDAVDRAGQQTRLLSLGRGREGFTQTRAHRGAVGALRTQHFTVLRSALSGHTSIGWEEGSRGAGTPRGQAPFKQILLPFARLHTCSLVWRAIRRKAIGLMGTPAFWMDAPHRAILEPDRTTVGGYAYTP